MSGLIWFLAAFLVLGLVEETTSGSDTTYGGEVQVMSDGTPPPPPPK